MMRFGKFLIGALLSLMLTTSVVALDAPASEDVQAPELIWTLEADPRGVDGTSEAAEFSPDSQLVVSGGGDGKLRLWRVSDGSLVWESVYWDGPLDNKNGEVEAVAFSPDGQQIAASGNSDGIKIYRASDGELITTLAGRGADGIAFSPDGQYFAGPSQRDRSDVRMFNPGDWSLRYRDRIQHRSDINSIDFTGDSTIVLSGAADKTVKMSRASDGELLRQIDAARGRGSVKSVRLSPDGQWIATANGGEAIARVFRSDTGEEVAALEHDASILEAVAFSTEGRYLVTGGGHSVRDPDGNFRGIWFYRVPDFEPIGQFNIHAQLVEYIDFSPDGRYMLTSSEDGTVKVWSVACLDPARCRQVWNWRHPAAWLTTAVGVGAIAGLVIQWRRGVPRVFKRQQRGEPL